VGGLGGTDVSHSPRFAMAAISRPLNTKLRNHIPGLLSAWRKSSIRADASATVFFI
jgi:hypothetical protein